jgi:pimeloyl-ACP methyl ester carboxylesterase
MTQPEVSLLQLNRGGNETFPVRYWSKGEGEPVLFLHGIDGVVWTPFFDKLAEHYKVLAFEHPGFVGTPRPEWLDTIEDLTFHYLDVLDALKLEKVHVVGHSLGGWMALELAVHAPERFKSLTVVDSLGLYDPKNPITDIFFMPYEDVAGYLYHRQETLDALPALDYITMNRNWTTVAQIGWNPRLHNPKLLTRLHRISAPTLIVWGEKDRFVPAQYGKRLQTLIANSKVEYLQDCGHMAPVECPDALFETVHKQLSAVTYTTK